jgi:sigma-B regulation protein RsbU (phosphoserine phosphatase)
MFRQSFGFRIFLLNFFLLILPVLVYLFLISKYEYDNKIKTIIFDLKDIGTAKASLFNDIIESDFRSIDYLINSIYFNNKNPTQEQIENNLINLQRSEGYAAVHYFEKNGDKIIAKASSDLDVIGEDSGFRNYLKDAFKTGKGIEMAYGGWPEQQPLLFIAKAIQNEKGEYDRVYVVVSFVRDLLSSLVNLKNISTSAKFSIITKNNTIFFSNDINFIKASSSVVQGATAEDIQKEELYGGLLLDAANINLTPIKHINNAYRWEIEKERYIGVKIPISNLDYYLLINENESIILNRFYIDFGKILIFLLLVIAIVVLVNILFIRRLSMPFNKLVEVIQQIGQGDYKASYKPQTLGFEINKVGLALNDMTKKFVSNLQSAKEERLKREVLAKELRLGREIQKKILPQDLPDFPQAEVYAYSLPGLEVAGDFYDVYAKKKEGSEEKKLIVTIGDTSGNGISGCLYSFGLRSMLRSYGMRYDDLRVILNLANTLFCLDTSKTSTFVTAFILEFDPSTNILQYGSAGHIPILHIRQDKTIEELSTKGIALGVTTEANFETNSTVIKKGDILFTYTNGILNLKNSINEPFGKERLKEFLLKNIHLSVKEMVENLAEELKLFSKGIKNSDDITLLAFKII